MTVGTTPIVQSHSHVCVLHHGESSRHPVVLQWVREGLADGQGVVLVEPKRTAEAFVEELGADGDGVVVMPPDTAFAMDDDGEPAVLRAVERNGGSDARGSARAVRRLTSPATHALAWFDDDLERYLRFETRLEELCTRTGIAALCHYDQVALDQEVIARAAAAHEIVVQLDDLALPTLDLRPVAGGIRASGEIDAANASIVVSWMTRHRGAPLVVDCSTLTFVDVAGLRALITYASEEAPITLALVNGAPRKLTSVLADDLAAMHVTTRDAAG